MKGILETDEVPALLTELDKLQKQVENDEFVIEEEDTLIFAGATHLVEEVDNNDLGLTLPKIVERMVGKKASKNEKISYSL